MKRRNLVFLLFLTSLCVPVLGADLQTLIPTGEITAETPSLEAAFPEQMLITRTPRQHGGVIDYEVRVYSEKPGDQKLGNLIWEVAIVVRDSKGADMLSAHLEASGVSTIPPNKNEFRSFRFSIHESLEQTTAINIGRHNGIRTPFTRYRLPMKSIDHPKAH